MEEEEVVVVETNLDLKGQALVSSRKLWKFYERMSFYRPYIYMNKYVNPIHDRCKIHFVYR